MLICVERIRQDASVSLLEDHCRRESNGQETGQNWVPAQSPTPGSPPSRRKRRIADWGKKGRRARNILGVVSLSN